VSLVTFFSFVFILAKTVSRCCYYYHYHSIVVIQTLFLPFQSHSRSGWVLKRENLLRLLEQNDFTWFSYYPAKLCSCVMATKYKRFRDIIGRNSSLFIQLGSLYISLFWRRCSSLVGDRKGIRPVQISRQQSTKVLWKTSESEETSLTWSDVQKIG